MNPYTPSRRSLFYGREELVRGLLADEQQGQSVILVGGRRCGKTRILEQLRTWLTGIITGANPVDLWNRVVPDASDQQPPEAAAPHWPVLISVEGRALQSLDECLEFVVDEIAKSLTTAGFPIPSQRPAEISTSGVESWLVQLDSFLATRRLGGLALLIDEVEVLFRTEWCHDLMAFMRVLDDRVLQTRVFFVLTGRHGLDDYIHPFDGSPPLNTLRRTLVQGLGYSARRRMTMEPFVTVGRLPLDDVAVREVDRWAGGNVWLLTLMLERIFNAPRLERTTMDEVVDELFNDLQVQDSFRRWADGLNQPAREIYQAVATRGVISTGEFRGEENVRARLRLEYQALVHRVGRKQIEMGPELFRTWALDENIVRPPFGARPLPNGDNASRPPGHYRYDVALSYASPQRDLARSIADHCRQSGLEIFYDRDLGHDLWGANLSEVLPSSYDRDSRLTILLVSEDYVQRRWPRVEAAASVTKAIRDGWSAVLMVSVDGTRLPDVPDSIVWLNLDEPGKTAADGALEIVKRLRASDARS